MTCPKSQGKEEGPAGLHIDSPDGSIGPFSTSCWHRQQGEEARSSQNQGCFPQEVGILPQDVAPREALGETPHSGDSLPSN